MKILVINTGSSSIKYQVFDMKDTSVLCSGLVEKIGIENEQVAFTHKKNQEKLQMQKDISSHKEGMEEVVKLLLDEKWGAVSDVSEIIGVGHRIVHGGKLSKSEIVDNNVINTLRDAIPLAPLHNPAGVLGIEVAMEIFKDAKHVVVLDTAFHQSMPAKAYMYALPYEYYQNLGVRKYGFHGTSHKYVMTKFAEIIGKPIDEVNAITVHLGNGSSISGIKNGKCIDTTMGMTPLDGLMMGTRCGSIDPAVIGFLAKNKNLSIDEIDTILTKKSGFLGVTGNSDLRTVEADAEKGEEKSVLSLEMLSYQIKSYVGSYIAQLGVMPDGIIFTAGVGENSPYVRGLSMSGMEHLGIEIDEVLNNSKYGEYMEFSKNDSKIKLFAIRTNEELEIAKQTVDLI